MARLPSSAVRPGSASNVGLHRGSLGQASTVGIGARLVMGGLIPSLAGERRWTSAGAGMDELVFLRAGEQSQRSGPGARASRRVASAERWDAGGGGDVALRRIVVVFGLGGDLRRGVRRRRGELRRRFPISGFTGRG